MTPADLIRRARERLTRCGTPADEDMIAALADALERAEDFAMKCERIGLRLESEQAVLDERDAAIKRTEAAEGELDSLRKIIAAAQFDYRRRGREGLCPVTGDPFDRELGDMLREMGRAYDAALIANGATEAQRDAALKRAEAAEARVAELEQAIAERHTTPELAAHWASLGRAAAEAELADTVEMLRSRVLTVEARGRANLKAALDKYGNHNDHCDYLDPDRAADCTCGLAKLYRP